MSKQPTKITVTDDNKVCISCRGKANDEQLSVFSELSCAGIAKRSSDVLNTISLSASNMDRVILRHKNKSLSVAVLEIDDNDMFYKENLPININNAIGIPVHLRKQLGITRLNAVVKVDRDTGFIFRKSINEQIVPILLTLFSVNVFRDENIWKSILLSLLAVPIVVYFNLSGKRNQRGAK